MWNVFRSLCENTYISTRSIENVITQYVDSHFMLKLFNFGIFIMFMYENFDIVSKLPQQHLVWIGNLNRQTFVIIPSSKSSFWKSKIEFNFLQIREHFIFLRKNEQKCWIKKICFKFKNSLNTNFRVSLNPPVLQTRIRDQTHTKTREIGRIHSRDDFPCVFGELKAHLSLNLSFLCLWMNWTELTKNIVYHFVWSRYRIWLPLPTPIEF